MKINTKTIGGLYLGFSLSYFANINFMNWKFYVIIVPFFLLWSREDNDEV